MVSESGAREQVSRHLAVAAIHLREFEEAAGHLHTDDSPSFYWIHVLIDSIPSASVRCSEASEDDVCR